MSRIRLFLTVGALIGFIVLPAKGATDEQLEQFKAQINAEIGAIKKDYESRIRTLEDRVNTVEAENGRLKRQRGSTAATSDEDVAALKQRIAELEQARSERRDEYPGAPAEIASLKKRLAKLEGVAKKAQTEVPAMSQRQAANEAAIEDIEKKLQASATETRDIYHSELGAPFDLTKLYDLPRPLEFHGYLRSGYGMNGEGGKMEAFIAPGAFAKYRLGNEAETYGEMALTNNWLREDDPLSAPYIRTTVMMSYSTGENFTFDSLTNHEQGNDIALRQAFIEGGNVFPAIPDIRVWAGQRYYLRMDIHIDDFYYLDMSGYGSGIEDVPIGKFAKLQLAWLGGSVDDYQVDTHGRLAKQNIDLRLTDINVPLGKLTLWLDYSNVRGGDVTNVFNSNGSTIHVQSSSGFAVGLFHRTAEDALFGGYNQFGVQYGQGAAYNFQSTLDSAGPQLDDAWHFRVTDHFTIQPWKQFAVQAVALYDKNHFGGPGSDNVWYSVGARPVYFFTDRFSTALEAGVDWVDSDPLHKNGHLWKVTFAPLQISRGQKFFSRPQLRAYVTYAGWSDDFKGSVGGIPYMEDTQGLSYGIQAEAWW
jgi:Maltoporin (phage lambda and maltose receptor)